MSKLADELNSAGPRPSRVPEKIPEVLASLKGADRIAFERALYDRIDGGRYRVSERELARIVTSQLGIRLSATSVGDWRRRTEERRNADA